MSSSVSPSASRPHSSLDTIVLRAFVDADAHQVCKMAANLSAHEGVSPPDLTPAELVRRVTGPERILRVLVAEEKRLRRLVGYAIFYPGYDIGSAVIGMHLADLWVEPEARDIGLGRALLAAVASACRQEGGRWLSWQAYRGNDSAIGFYDKVGGRRVQSVAYDMGPREMEALLRKVRVQREREESADRPLPRRAGL